MFLWPIKQQEMALFCPMALMMFCLLFNFSALRAVKDSLVVPSMGAEVISFLKLWLVLPSAVIFTLIYIKLSNIYSMENVFYTVVVFFLLFFIFFAFIIYPHQILLHPSNIFVEKAIFTYPYLQWIIKIGGKWSYAIMYIFCELWSVVVINLMYWQFVNNIFNIKDAKRFYPILGMIGNLGLIVAGNILISCADTSEAPNLIVSNIIDCNCNNKSEITLKLIIIAVTFSGLIAIITFKYLNKIISKKQIIIHKSNNLLSNFKLNYNRKTKLSIKDSINLVLKSKYIGCIAIMVICYGLAINILEGPWKAKVRELYPTTQEYVSFMGQFNIAMGISCVAFMIISSNILRRFNWLVPALLTPTIIGITGIIFFLLVIVGNNINTIFGTIISFNPIYFAVLIGALQNILSKSSKYSLFDPTKEVAYIPLNDELKTKGKAAVEVVGMKLGKSGGACIQSTIFTIYPSATFDSIATILMCVFILVISIWLIDVIKLYHQYITLNHGQ